MQHCLFREEKYKLNDCNISSNNNNNNNNNNNETLIIKTII